MTDLHQIKRLSIRDYLSHRGIQPARENTRCGFYLSPLRAEHTPSFKVDYMQNLWYDHGTGKGGSIIDMVMSLGTCDKSQAIRLLGNGEISPITSLAPVSAASTVLALRILTYTSLQHAALIGYLRERGIDPKIAAAYCREIRYTINDKSYFAIGFRNDAGGWELRSEHFKGGSTPKHITTLDNGSNTILVFEGFMDFLSYLTLKENAHPTCDTAVLNSVVNLPKALPFLERHAVIHTFLDNDEAGRKATAAIIRQCPRSQVVDQAFYRDYKDVNEYLQARIRAQQRSPPAIKTPRNSDPS